MLGFGRALGETMAVTMVIGNNPQVSASLFAPQYTMAAVIANEFTEAADELYLHALIEIGLVLFVITLIVNVAVAAADLEHGAERAERAPSRGCRRRGSGRMSRDHAGARRCRRCSSASAALSVLLALVPLALILFFVVSQGMQVAQPRLLHAHAEAGRRDRAAAWRTRSSAR